MKKYSDSPEFIEKEDLSNIYKKSPSLENFLSSLKTKPFIVLNLEKKELENLFNKENIFQNFLSTIIENNKINITINNITTKKSLGFLPPNFTLEKDKKC